MAIAYSSDGTRIAVADGFGGGIYVSTDSGVTWINSAPDSNYTSIVYSSNNYFASSDFLYFLSPTDYSASTVVVNAKYEIIDLP